MTVDVASLWDFTQPDLSEERFRAALHGAQKDDTLILTTQIARTFGLRRDFARAREILAAIEGDIAGASAEARSRYWLELGRTYASAAHPPAAADDGRALEAARGYYARALACAREGGEDGLAIDAIHMLAFVDTAPADQLQWGQRALAVCLASSQPAAMRWQASIRNNVGYALHLLGRYQEALDEFMVARELRVQKGDPELIGVADWMIAWTLRAMARIDEALEIQLRLEREYQARGEPSRYVFEELELLYRELGQEDLARDYRNKRDALAGQS